MKILIILTTYTKDSCETKGKKKKELRQLFYNCHENSLASTDFHFSFTKIKTKQKTSKQVLKWTC